MTAPLGAGAVAVVARGRQVVARSRAEEDSRVVERGAVDQRVHLFVERFAHGIERIQGVDRVHQIAQRILALRGAHRVGAAQATATATATDRVPVAAVEDVVERRSHGVAGHDLAGAVIAAAARHSVHHRTTCYTWKVNKKENKRQLRESCWPRNEVKSLLFMSGGQKGDKDWPRSQLGMVGKVTLPGDITLALFEP